MKFFGKSVYTRFVQVLAIMVIMVLLMGLYHVLLDTDTLMSKEGKEIRAKTELFSKFEDGYATLTKYTIYGKHLNLGGVIENADSSFKYTLAMVTLDGAVIEYPLVVSFKDNKLYYTLGKDINEGIDLEDIPLGEYYLAVKTSKDAVVDEQSQEINKYYSLNNTTLYSDQEYYTTTTGGKNYKDIITFSAFNEKEYMALAVTDIKSLPEDVYDIVIDAGHGARDTGAVYQDIQEKDYTLKISLALQKRLEELGYKVYMTRVDDSKYIGAYGEDGRAVAPYKAHAKLFLSVHLNYTEKDNSVGGVEIYTANHMNLTMAKEFADSVKNTVKVNYSQNNINKVLDGVYVRTYTEAEVKEAIDYAKEIGYEPYTTISTDTPYYFAVRETGGIMTGAYTDGRNKEAGDNPYHNSNIAAESYLLELGFINCPNDAKNIKTNTNSYVEAITNVVVNNYGKIEEN